MSSRSLIGNDRADFVLDCLEDPLRRLDPGPGRRANVELDATAIDIGIEVAADEEEHAGAEPSTSMATMGTMYRRSSSEASNAA